MNTLQKILNIRDSNGAVKTFFGGRLTLSQIIVFVIVILVVVLAIKLLKGVVKVITTVVSLCICLIYFGLASPIHMKDVTSTISKRGIASYSKLADVSNSIRIKGNSVSLKVNGKWFDVSDIDSFIKLSDKSVSVVIDGKSYKVDDESIVKLLSTFK